MHATILTLMPTLEINATQPWLISHAGNVAEVEQRFHMVEELAVMVSANSDKSRESVFQRATRFHQSILQKAFTGELA